MHEFAITRSLIDAAETEARAAGAVRVKALRCRIGVLRHVDDWLIQVAFEAARDGTLCAGATLAVEKAPLTAECPACRRRFAVNDWDWRCPDCATMGVDAAGGDELTLLSIEAEVPDEYPGLQERVSEERPGRSREPRALA